MDIIWDMTSSDPISPLPQLLQSHWTPRTVPNTRFGKGMVRLKFDVKKDIQARLDQAEKNLRDMEPERRQTAEAYIERLEYDIFHNREKLSVLGVAGYKQSDSQEEREKILDESWRKRPEATEGSTVDEC
ncbi:hypothetical protein E8E11_008957 [Didymella keratinophila]|nr:hypothetical protein E8E11_008957 [Didymella keratinophila]